MEARPYKLVAESERTRIRAALQQATDAWAQEWVRDADICGCDITIREGHKEAGPVQRWIRALSDTEGSLWLGLSDRLHDAVERGLYGRSQRTAKASALVAEVADLALKDLARELLKRHGKGGFGAWIEGDAPPGWFRHKGSGALFASARLLGEELEIVVDPAYVNPQQSRGNWAQVKPLPRLRAVDREPVVLRTWVGAAQISIGTLGTMSVGDVLVLDSRIEDKIAFRPQGSETDLLHGFVGSCDDKKAVQISVD